MTQAEIATPGVSRRRDWRPLVARWATLGALIALIVFNLFVTRNFASWRTLDVNLTQVASIVIVGVGMTLVIATGGIDVGAKAEIQRIIKQLAEDGLGVLMISSELEEVIEGSDRIFVLRDGRSVAEMSHDEASEAAVMAAMAHGEIHSGEQALSA